MQYPSRSRVGSGMHEAGKLILAIGWKFSWGFWLGPQFPLHVDFGHRVLAGFQEQIFKQGVVVATNLFMFGQKSGTESFAPYSPLKLLQGLTI